MANSKEYFLIDLTRNKNQEQRMRMCEVASFVCLYHNHTGNITDHIYLYEKEIAKYWKWDKYPPSVWTFQENISLSNIKWYIREHLKIERDHIWNSDFLIGLSKYGKLTKKKEGLPTLRWKCSFDISNILKECPFSGVFSDNIDYPYKRNTFKSWKQVTAFLLPRDKSSGSFLAGILAGGRVLCGEKDSEGIYRNAKDYNEGKSKSLDTFVVYPSRFSHVFKFFGIPIEGTDSYGRIILSPVWGALFTIYMPESCKSKFLNLYNPVNADVYCPILWRAYVDKSDYIVNGIPYLKCRRAIYYKYDGDESYCGSTIEKLNALRIRNNLTILDNLIINCVKEWGNKAKEEKSYVCNNS